MSRARRSLGALLVAAAAIPGAGAVTGPCAAARADGARHAGLVVQFSGTSVRELCVSFTAEEERRGFTGADLLRRSELPVIFGGGGTALTVCKIATTGCDAPGRPCFCDCPVATSSRCRFWGYYTVASGGAWRFSELGAGLRLIHDGDVDGWRYGPHSGARGAPAGRDPAGVCSRGEQVGLTGAAVAKPGEAPRGWGGLAAAAAVIAALVAGTVGATRRRRARG
jgi:hypothetical protein